MNPQPDPTARFLIGVIANGVRILLTPYYYIARSDMGIQWATPTALLIPGIIYIAGFFIVPMIENGLKLLQPQLMSRAGAPVMGLYILLLVLGFIRNTMQAWSRRRRRDWSVHSWSTGRPLLEPVLVLLCRAIYRAWGVNPWVRRLGSLILTEDFIYYVAEPVMLLLGAAALASTNTTSWALSILIAAILIVVRIEAQLWLYLKAHEVMDAKKLEGAVKGQLEGPAINGGGGMPIAQIPLSLTARPPTDEKSVFDRLSPDLQLLLSRDRATRP